MRWGLLSVLLLLGWGCAEYAPELGAASPVGCWRLEAEAWGPPLEPGPIRMAARVPEAVSLSERAFLLGVEERDLEMHRFDPRRASEAHLVLPDTALRVAWWAGEADSIGVGNHNRWGGWYVAALVRGDRLRGEVRWIRYGAEGAEVERLHRAAVTGRRESCASVAATPRRPPTAPASPYPAPGDTPPTR